VLHIYLRADADPLSGMATVWKLAAHCRSLWTAARHNPSGDPRAGPPQGTPSCSRAGGDLEGRSRQHHRFLGLRGVVARAAVAATVAAARRLEPLLDGPSARAERLSDGALACGSILSDLACLAGLLPSALAGAGAHARGAVRGLAATIGEPPQRPFEESSTGVPLSLAVDAAVVCLILAACLSAMGFATMPRGCGVGGEPAPFGSEDDQDEAARPIHKSTGVFIAVILPVLSGGVLSIKHSLVWALLCGL